MAEPPRGPDAGRPVPVPIDAAARDRVVDLLAHSFAEDRLTEAELETRLDAVYRATTRAELDALVAGLPAPVAPEPTTRLAQAGTAPATGRIRAVFSGQEQSLSVVPRRLKVKARFGYVELDLTRARFEKGVTEIRVRAFMGYVQIRLPPGVRVESTGRGLFGYFSTKGSGSVDLDAPVVRIRGKAIFGFAECWVPSDDSERASRIGPGSEG
jgi:DUF1707 SHOCT-like domain